MFRVCLDPGHGGKDPGAVSPTGLTEASIVLDVCHRLRALLERQGVVVFMTRTKDLFVPLAERPRFANVNDCHAFISVHCNSAEAVAAQGWEVFTTVGQNNSDILATCIGQAYGEANPRQRARTDMRDGDLDKEAGFAVIRGTDHPSCLMELGFISNPIEEVMMESITWRHIAACALADGILNYAALKNLTV